MQGSDKPERWEYMTMSYNSSYGATSYAINEQKEAKLRNRPLHEVLTLFGQHGWELVSAGGADSNILIFKRLSTAAAQQERTSEA